jgi:CDGSH-type Zn-finger protein
MAEITIRLKENGPYRITLEDAPNVVILDHLGNRLEPAPGRPIALCRCGGSLTKPFCDGTHSRIGFRGAAAAVAEADQPTIDPPPT